MLVYKEIAQNLVELHQAELECGYAFDLAIMSHFFNYMQAARDTGALKEAKDKLEKQLEELTWRLQLEKRLRVISRFNSSFNSINHIFKVHLCFVQLCVEYLQIHYITRKNSY